MLEISTLSDTTLQFCDSSDEYKMTQRTDPLPAPPFNLLEIHSHGFSLVIRVNQFANDVRVPEQLPKPARLGGLG